MKKTFITTICMSLILASCGIKYTPSINTTPTNSINFATDLKREARGCAIGILFFPPVVTDISVAKVAKENNFKKVVMVDHESNFYVLFNETCTVIHGE